MYSLDPMLAAKAAEGARLHFSGDLTWWLAVLIGLGAAGLAAWIYRGDLRGRTTPGLWVLPVLRGFTVMLVVMMLSGPVIQNRTSVGTTARVLMYVDASASMKATDEQMETQRKLRILRRLGWLEGGADEAAAGDALDRLGELRRVLTAMAADTANNLRNHVEQGELITKQAANYLEAMELDGWTDNELEAFKADLLDPFLKLDPEQADENDKANLLALQPAVDRWEQTIRNLLPQGAAALDALDPDTRAAVERFDRTPRWQRLETQLLEGAGGLVNQLAAEHNVELLALTARRFQMLWHPGALGNVAGDEEAEAEAAKEAEDNPLSTPRTLPVAATNMVTDLTTGILEGAVSENPEEKLFVVLFTDGQHNVDGASPLEMAAQLKDRGIAVHVVGMGTTEVARDLAVLKAETPSAVYPDARLTGHVIVQDGMDPGKPFTVRIEHHGVPVWQREFVTARKRRKLPFDFPIKDIVAAEQTRLSRDLRYANLPLVFNVVIPPVEGESKDDNNAGTLRVNVVTQKPRILFVDTRPRWEFRYLRNLLERDERWDVNTIQANWTNAGTPSLGPRGNQLGQFPNARDLLFQYQLVILGDVGKDLFAPAELQWVRDFVQLNGGGMIFIDGRMERHFNFSGTPVYDLLPVKLAAQGQTELRSLETSLRFRSAGGAQAPLMLAADSASNLKIWNDLPGPRWAALSEALPGAETLLEIVDANTQAAIPGLVFRRFGAGRVLYSAFDESWRWRKGVADMHHQRYWNQVAKWIMEPPFAVQDAFIALDSGPTTYELEETAPIRVRITNPQLAANPNLKPEAAILREGRVFGTVPLDPDPQSFTFRGETAPLESGDYEVRVRIPGVPDGLIKASTAFTVATNPFGELGRLHCDELLLRQIAKDSGGEYYREEEMQRLVELLGPASDHREITEEIQLWQSYWWFVPIMLLLTAEWILRRTKGLV